jgi:ribonuclease D
MADTLITEQQDFEDICAHIREFGTAAFDTEFISENTFHPVLCLVQLATEEECVAVDPFEVDLTSWWEIMADDETTVIVHAGREETRFCLREINQPPRRLVDVQIAEGLRSASYPLSYERLISRVMGKSVNASETRTDWKRRPLTDRQIDYALDDVRFLPEAWRRQREWLETRGRLSWAYEEFERMVNGQLPNDEDINWRRCKGAGRLKPRQLAVLKELFVWRLEEAERQDKPVRRVLRDDLLVDLAKRQPRTENDLLNSRDMNRSNFRRSAAAIVESIKRGLDIDNDDLPSKHDHKDSGPDDPVIVKFLLMALSNRCAELEISNGLVGTSNDLKEFVRWHNYGKSQDKLPRLGQGWRAEVCFDLLEDVIGSKVSVRIADATSVYPLVFDRVDE